MALLFGIVYPVAVTGATQLILPSQADDGLARDGVGAAVRRQAFVIDRYPGSDSGPAGREPVAGPVTSSRVGPDPDLP